MKRAIMVPSDCVRCSKVIEPPHLAPCGHYLCHSCYTECFPKPDSTLPCPTCRLVLSPPIFAHQSLREFPGVTVPSLYQDVLEVYDIPREHLATLGDYNAFLEQRNENISNLLSGKELQETKARLKEIISKQRGDDEEMKPGEFTVQKYVRDEFARFNKRKERRENLVDRRAHGNVTLGEFLKLGKEFEKWDNDARSAKSAVLFAAANEVAAVAQLNYIPTYNPNQFQLPKPKKKEAQTALPTKQPAGPVDPLEDLQNPQPRKPRGVSDIVKLAGGYLAQYDGNRKRHEAFNGLFPAPAPTLSSPAPKRSIAK